jgi:hypothetical protein
MNREEIQRRLLFILHRGLVELRLLAQGQKSQNILDLSDALEPIPGYLNQWEVGYLEQIRSILKGYQAKYPDTSFDYERYVDVDIPPERF